MSRKTSSGRATALPGWLYVLFLALLATGTDEFIIAGILPEVASDLDVGTSAAGQLVTAFAVVYALSAPVLAVVFGRFAKRSLMVGGLVVFVLANAGAALAPGYPELMACRVVAALAAAVVTSAAFTTAAEGAPDGMSGRYLSVATAGMTAALFTGVPLGSWLGGVLGWRATFWLIAVVAAVAAAGLLGTAPRIGGSAPAPLRERLAPLRSTAVLRLVAVTFLAGSGGLMFYTYLSAYVARTASESHTLLSLMLLVVGVAGLAGALLSGRASDALGPRRGLHLVIGGHVIALALAAGIGFGGVGGPLVVGAVVAFWSVFAWGLNPPIQGSIMRAAGPEAGMPALALNISGLYLGTGVAGALGGILVAATDVRFVPLLASGLLLVSFLLTLPRSPGAAGGRASRRAERPDGSPSRSSAPPDSTGREPAAVEQ
ncbi:putative MFS family arabinose efflux permease [Actinopolyspora biskrensis]|uniref:Putative MFS family arabinose efflux permease n=1 Tax=Actinopolyspora biskrensis TaxID=1470178 RepID=A0A852Z0E0_9ACTN|nr:MFS transporter [Actinopolyspora biskrensis]NYH79259.1 putative MFS family arabinose efflux permease [Actinopolyspora biskrensis]